MRQGFQKKSDMRQAYFLNPTCDMAINKQKRHATLAFLKIDRRHGDHPVKGPITLDVYTLSQYVIMESGLKCFFKNICHRT